MITKKEVEHIAKLARLGLTKKEIEKMRGELSPILDYIEKLKEINVKKITPTSHLVKVENIIREDQESRKPGKGQKLLDSAPETKNGYLKVKSILQ